MYYESYFSLWGDVRKHSPGTAAVMADRQIKRAIKEGTVDFDDSMGNAKAVVTCRSNRKWFMIAGGWGNDRVYTAMMGAVCGDIAGSAYERNNATTMPDKDRLIRPTARFTDDTVMTCAVAEGLRTGLSNLPRNWESVPGAEEELFASVQNAMQYYGKEYPGAGYGRGFRQWIFSADPKPYHSRGNGSAMRVSYAGWLARSLEEAEKLAEITAKVTHDHPEGITGARVVAGCIFLLRRGASKTEVYDYVKRFYNMDFSLRDIRRKGTFDVTCAGTVPVAVKAFLEGNSFVDVIANAIYVGGDSDTIAAIAGSIAEVIYPIPQGFRGRAIDRLDPLLRDTIADAVDYLYLRNRDGE